MSQEVLAIDSQVLNMYELCHRKTKYYFVDGARPMIKEAAFDKGGLLHDILKVHYLGIKQDTARIQEMFGNIELEFPEHLDYPTIMSLAKKYGNLRAVNTDLPMEDCMMVMATYVEYANYYRGETWLPQIVEQPFSVVLYEEPDIKILYEGITDLVTQDSIVDHKSSSRRGEPHTLSNQFIGYCWAFNINNIVINKVGFQKTLKAKDKFERYTKSYPKSLREEWREHAITRAIQLYHDLKDTKKMETDFNFTACDKYSGCVFTQVCTTEPEARDWKLRNKYLLKQEWNPAKELEKEK